MKRLILSQIVAVLLLSSTGCMMMQSGKDAMTQSMRMFRPKPFDEVPDHNPEDDEWDFVGNEGRGDQPRERETDRWWHNLVMSPEARSIERNLGID